MKGVNFTKVGYELHLQGKNTIVNRIDLKVKYIFI